MRYLFVSAQLAGHLDWGGYLATATALQQRGHEVTWASGPAVAPLVEATKLSFAPLAETGWRWPPPPPLTRPADLSDEAWRQVRGERALDQWLDPPRVEAAVAALHAVASDVQPDVVVSEMFVAAAGVVAERINKPLVVAGWPAVAPHSTAGDALTQMARQRLERLLATTGCGGVNFTAEGPPALRSPHLHLAYWTARWYAGLPLLPQTRCVGGLPLAELPVNPTLPASDDLPWVVITLGTTFNRDPAFFVAAAHAAHQLGCLPILLLGRTPDPAGDDRWLERLPPTAIVRDRADFRTLLPYAAAAIHHGGAGTTHALARAALPQIVVPHAADQIHQAQGLTRTGAGLHLPPKTVTVARLVEALAAILPDWSPVRAQAAVLAEEMAALGGAPAAATLLETLPRMTS
ncbi:nucleotide disphospho-sugar-binding domain-containing protein [Caldilinea sp.]|uniref:glycosyltransferase n=1 Tax=Caldilinea sp. TaxID=2293560 RepID=UPI002D19EAD2|nr:glycosyltransferase [Caldilinea sp.]HRA65068.1 glycosyltransferase [Caldilinea sp.]